MLYEFDITKDETFVDFDHYRHHRPVGPSMSPADRRKAAEQIVKPQPVQRERRKRTKTNRIQRSTK